MNRMNFLVTGGAGFIGSNCVERLAAEGHRIRVADNLSTGKLENLKELMSSIEFIKADIGDMDTARQAVDGMDYIIHLAAIPSVHFSVEDPLKANSSMITATLSLFKAAVDYGKIKRIVQTVSAAAYGDNPILPKKEDMLPEPLSPYAAAKLGQEYYGKVFSNIYGLQVTSLRLFNVYGPKQDPKSPYSGVISQFLSRMLSGQQVTVFGDGNNTRDFVYVGDVVDAIYRACFAKWTGKSEVLNIGTSLQTDLNRLIEIISDILGLHLKPDYVKPRTGDILHSVADISNAKRILGYLPKTSIEEGLAKLVEYYRVNRLSG
jgi:UDP-glucose 4-epimerase